MRTFKIIVFAALAVFHLAAIIIISVGRNNFEFLLDLFNKLDLMLYCACFGLVLFALVILFDWLNEKKIKSLHKKHQEEINELKARLYDNKESTPLVEAAPVTDTTAEVPQSYNKANASDSEADKK